MKRVLLLGGTGAMGKYLANILVEQNYEVYITTRKKRQADNIHYYEGNAHDIEFIGGILSKNHWDAIVDFMVYGTAEFSNRFSLYLEATDQYVYISSARVFANVDSRITERSPRLLDVSTDKNYLLTDEYALTKARQEDLLRNSYYKNWTIVRPYITFSEDRLQLGVYEKESWLYRALSGRPIIFSKDIAQHYTTMTYGKDVALGIAGLIGNSRAIGEDFNIMTNETHTWSEILALYIDVLAKKTGTIPKVCYTEHAVNLRFNTLKYQVKYCRLFDRCFDNTKLMQTVPALRFSSTLDTLQRCLEQFIERGCFSGSTRVLNQAILDKVSGEYIPPKDIHGIRRRIGYIVYRCLPWFILKRVVYK